MRASSTRLIGLACAWLVIGSGVAFASLSPATLRGWAPTITLTGLGDPNRAVTALRGASELWRVTLHETNVDAQTEQFVARAFESLEDFDLRGLHELLPEVDGEFRQLRVQGGRVGARYMVTQARDASFEVHPSGSRRAPGDTSLVVRSTGVPALDGDTNYLLQGRAGIVVGPISWSTVVESNRQWLRLFTAGTTTEAAARPMSAIRHTALQANPRLQPDDIEAIATLWEAFPRMSYLLSSLGRIDDVLLPQHASGAQHLRLLLRADVDRIQQRYPELASYLDGLGKLFNVDIAWVDNEGRTLATLHVDSEHLQARLEAFAVDGRIVPSRGEQVFVDAPIDPSRPMRYRTRVRTDFRMMGMYSHMRDGRMDFAYEPSERGMELRARMTHVPTITVDGAALGLIPAGLVDAFIPGDLQSLITEFLTTACTGNEGRGIAVTARFDRPQDGAATVDVRGGFEALNNFLVKLGLRFFNNKVMPDIDVQDDVRRLMADAQGAFQADLDRFAREHAR